MNLGQMILVILAAILFSTFIIAVFNSMMVQMENAVVNLYMTQGVKIADQVLQEYEAKILSHTITFDEVYNTLNGGITKPPVALGGADYIVSIISRPCSTNGSIVGSLGNHQRIDVMVRIVADNREYYVGNETNPFSKVFSRI